MNHVMRALEACVLVLLGAVLLNLVQTGSAFESFKRTDISSAEFISIILTALGVILAALAIFLGGLAVVSWRMFDDRVKSHAENYLRQRMNPSDPEFSQVVADIKEAALLEVSLVVKKDRDILNDEETEASD